MTKRSQVSKEKADKLRKENPQHFSELGKKGAAARKNPYYHFSKLKEDNPEKLREISSAAGKKSRRIKKDV